MKLALLDILRPYFFAGMDLGPGVNLGPGVQDALGTLHVDEYDAAWNADAVVISGIARIDSENPSSPFFSPRAGGGSPSSPTSASSNDLIQWEWHDVAVRFRITVARQPAAALQLPQIIGPAATVLGAWGSETGTTPTDYPNTQFRMELMFELVTVTIPRLIGAKLDGFLLVPDPANRSVKISLPRVLLILTQDSAETTNFDVRVGSFGAETLDDTDPAIANLLRMNPPYALFPSEQVGFGFRKAILDLSDDRTPPELLDLFGVGENWQGIYLPEIRFFASSQRSAGVAFNIGAREMLIGLDPTPGIWGEFSVDLDFQGDALRVGLRLYGVSGARFDPELVISDETAHADRYRITVPSTAGPDTENYVLFVDVTSGAAPFAITAVSGEEHPADLSTLPDNAFFDDAGNQPNDISVLQRMRLFSQDQRVAIRVVSTRNPAQHRVIVLDLFPDHQTSASTQPAQPETPQARFTTASATSVSVGTVVIESQTDTAAILRFNPANVATFTVDGLPRTVTGGVTQVQIRAGESHDIQAMWNMAGQEKLERFSLFFQWNFPQGQTDGIVSRQGDLDALRSALNSGQPGLIVRVDAYASRDSGTAQTEVNNALSQRRADVILRELGAIPGDVSVQSNHWGNRGHPGSPADVDPRLIDGQVPNNHSAETERNLRPNYEHNQFQVAVVSLLRVTPATDTFTGTLHRDPVKNPDTNDGHPQEPPAPQGQTPGFLRHIGGTVRFERDAIPVAYELRLTIDYKTAHEQGLEQFRADIDAIGPGLEEPEENRLPKGNPNPDKGEVEFRLALTYDPSTSAFTETLVARAAESARDGLWSWGSIPDLDAPGEPASDGWRDVLGLYFTLAPLLAETAADAAAGGEIVPLVIGLAAPVAITVLGVAHVLRFTHYGVELDVRHDEDEVHASLLFDVESAIWLNLKIGNFVIVTNRPDKPAKIRYKAIGFRFDAPPDQEIQFLPVFDSSRGYTLDLADSGSLKVLPSLGDSLSDFIQVLGARIARTNPLNIEIELGMGVDLGVVSVDRFGFRLPIDPLGTPSITAIGVSVDITSVLTGRGYLKINERGFVGQLDLTLESVKIRIAGGLGIENVTEGDRSATAVIVTLAVELPGGIPLGGTGLAVFGVLGLFAMHEARLEIPTARNPALDWFVNSVYGDPTDLRGWGPHLDQWAFGVGLVAGTIEGGTVLNLKGMLVLELPGPRVLLFVKANILSAKPDTKGADTGALFAIVDISPQRVLIGIQFSYEITKDVLEITIPAEAGFFYDPPLFPPKHFYVDVGSIAQPITAKILKLIDATAYFMVHGDGICNFPLGALQGFSVATGFRASFTWGNTDIGLYLRIAAGFDVGIGFKPLFFAGRVFIEGELRLFIVSIEANAKLVFRTNGVDTIIDGEVCGRVDFFFFSVKGCVGFTIGTDPAAPPPPEPIRDLMLQSRSPALVEGSGVDRGIDTVLCRGTTDGSVPKVEVREGDVTVQREVFVPIDTIPLIQFEVAPEIDPAATIDGQLSSGLPAGFPGGWQKRGQNYLRYTIDSIELELVALHGAHVSPGTQPVTDGPRPYTWRHPAQAAGSDGLPVELALLDWKPSNVDKALVQSEALDSLVDSRWEDVCTPVAEAARVLWTFRFEPLGSSPEGWCLEGLAWPDAPATKRSLPVNTALRVRETWRTGTFLDGLLPATEASVVGISARCPQRPGRPIPPHVHLSDQAQLARSFTSVISPLRGRSPVSLSGQPLPVPGGILSRAISMPCIAKVLRAPYEVEAESLALPNDPLGAALLKLDQLRKEDLRDVVRLSGGPFVELSLLIFARIKMPETGLIQVRAFAPGSAEIAGVTAAFTLISMNTQLPPRWVDLGGTWWDDVRLARDYFSVLNKDGGWGQYLVQVKLPEPALMVDIGVRPLAVAIHEFEMNQPAFFLAVIDGLTEQEVARAGDDEDESQDDQDGLGDALGDQQHALLLPDAQYRVVVRYTGEIGAKRDAPEEGQDLDEIAVLRTSSDTATRTFFTDREPPRSLDPWMLAQFPAPEEQYHFYEETVVIVFATDDVLELYKAYDRELRAVAHAASFRGSAGTPESPLTHLLLTPLFERIEGAILSPWEATVRGRLSGAACLEFDPDAPRHGRVPLPFALDPLTDYVLDLEMLDKDGQLVSPPLLPGEVGNRPLYRQGFSTSRYPTRAAFAEALRLTLVGGRLASNFAPLAALTERVSDEAFDQALRDAQFETSARPETPRVTVLWNTSDPPEPQAILIETPEPVWRTRREPEAEHDESGEHIVRWLMSDRLWLSVDELVRDDESVLVANGAEFVRRTTGVKTMIAQTISDFRNQHIGTKQVAPLPMPPVPIAFVDRFARDASGTRTLAILKPGTRGKTVSLGLARNLHPLLDIDTTDTPVVLCEVDLSAAPWEELL